MKKQILDQLKEIKKLSKKVHVTGQLILEIETNNITKFDTAIESIKEFPRFGSNFEISERLNVRVLMA